MREEIISSLENFAENHSKDTGGFIAGESMKGVNFINALIKKHSVVVANPPYSGKRNWPKQLSDDLKEIYNKKANDLYSCFIDRCIDLSFDNGFIRISDNSFIYVYNISRRIKKENYW